MFKKLFQLNDGMGIEDSAFLSVRLSYHAHVVASIFLAVFALYNLASGDIFRTVIDLSALLLTSGAIIHYRKTSNQAVLQNAVIVVLMVVMIPAGVMGENEHFTLLWTIFFPIFAIMAKGRKTGIILTVLFYLIVFPIAYQGIGVWQDGQWTFKSFVRYTLVSVMLTSLIYYFKYIYDSVFIQLLKHINAERDLSGKLEVLSVTDHLTGLKNRRSLERDFDDELNRAKRDNKYISFIILDVDYFKRYNDTYGHAKGDDALKTVADVILQTLSRASDRVYRLGGEEFGAIVTANEPGKTVMLAQKINIDIESMQIEHVSTELAENCLTISVGVCEKPANEVNGIADLYHHADEALYTAKERGRNGVMIYKPEECKGAIMSD